jgi:hypothetical protein
VLESLSSSRKGEKGRTPLTHQPGVVLAALPSFEHTTSNDGDLPEQVRGTIAQCYSTLFHILRVLLNVEMAAVFVAFG